jgi:negative regulator of sigma E activity
MRRNRASLLAVAVCAAAFVAAPLPGGARPRPVTPSQLLREAVSAYARYSYVGKVQNIDYGTDKANAVLFRIEHRAPDLTRRWYLAPESLYGDSIISRGDVSYQIDPGQDRIVVTKDDALDDQVAEDDNFDLLLRNYRAVMGPDDNVAERPAYSVLLINKYTGESVMRISIDRATKLVLQRERYSPTGSVSHQMRFEEISFTGNIPAQLFAIPRGYTTTYAHGHDLPNNDVGALLRQAGFRAMAPRYLPEGFYAIAGDVSTVEGVRTLHLLYSDGLRTVSLFENARGSAVDMSRYTAHQTTVEGHPAQYVSDGPTTLIAWARGNLHLALVGEISRYEMMRIASSVNT